LFLFESVFLSDCCFMWLKIGNFLS
jgi:hypothetical protein